MRIQQRLVPMEQGCMTVTLRGYDEFKNRVKSCFFTYHIIQTRSGLKLHLVGCLSIAQWAQHGTNTPCRILGWLPTSAISLSILGRLSGPRLWKSGPFTTSLWIPSLSRTSVIWPCRHLEMERIRLQIQAAAVFLVGCLGAPLETG